VPKNLLVLATSGLGDARVAAAAATQKQKEASMTQKSLDPAALSRFTGSEHWYRHGLVRGLVFTDGAKHIADRAGAYWLLDEIAIAQRFDEKVSAEEFQVWALAVNADRSAVLTCEDGSGNTFSPRPSSSPAFRPRA
jgi:hypothetical protein